MTFPFRLSHWSISTRLALWYGLSLLILLTVFVAVLYTSVHVGLHQGFEARLRADARSIRQHLQAHDALAGGRTRGTSLTHPGSIPAETLVRTIDAEGLVLESSIGADREVFAPQPPEERASALRAQTWQGRPAQTMYLPLAGTGTEARWLEVTKVESALHRQLHRLRWWLVLGIVLASGLAVGVGYGLARKALRPVAVLTDAANDMKDRPTGTLPTEFGTEDELSALADTFNDLVQRLRAMVARERRFRADAAHEMFTPLTAMQSEIDVTLRAERSTDTYRSTLETLREHTEELSAMLDRLMTLSRAEARDPGPAAASTDVASLVEERAGRLRSAAADRAITLDVAAADSAAAPIQADHLTLIVDHLLDNALKYTPDGGTVQVDVKSTDDAVVLKVSDIGIGFSPEAADRLFDRFHREPAAEDTASGGGLGLSIVQALVRSYRGSIEARSDGPGTGSTFEVKLPAAETAS